MAYCSTECSFYCRGQLINRCCVGVVYIRSAQFECGWLKLANKSLKMFHATCLLLWDDRRSTAGFRYADINDKFLMPKCKKYTLPEILRKDKGLYQPQKSHKYFSVNLAKPTTWTRGIKDTQFILYTLRYVWRCALGDHIGWYFFCGSNSEGPFQKPHYRSHKPLE